MGHHRPGYVHGGSLAAGRWELIGEKAPGRHQRTVRRRDNLR